MTTKRFHFVDDYRALVRNLLRKYPRDEAMSRAVGGSYDALGEIEKQLLLRCGLKPDHIVLDVGCGSGRLAKALVPFLKSGQFLGTDVVPELLQYAREGVPSTWQFAIVENLRIPLRGDRVDFACFFSVFTHLLHEETYCYLLEARRVVKRGGCIVFSFLEYDYHWEIFEATVATTRSGKPNVHLNTFIARDAIAIWARKLSLTIVEMHAGTEPFIALSHPIVYDNGQRKEGVAAFGQSVCVLRNDKPVSAAAAR